MRRLIVTAAAFSVLCLFAGCQEPREESAEPSAAAAAATPPTSRDVPSDGSIVCPGSGGCPLGRAPAAERARNWSGIVIPQSALTANDVVCIAGQRPSSGSPCPDGWSGRLWREPPVEAGGAAPRPSGQLVCRPGSTERVCRNLQPAGSYAFLCRGDKRTYCPGVPRVRDLGDATQPTEPGDADQESVTEGSAPPS